MKKNRSVIPMIALWATLSFFSFPLIAQQVPQGIRYQAVLRNGNQLLNNTTVDMEFSIVQAGTTVYQEEQVLTSNTNGLVLASIGEGTALMGQFDSIAWALNPTELRVRVDIGAGMEEMGIERLMTVPYAFLADRARTVDKLSFFDLIDVDGNQPSTGQVLTWNGSEWAGQDIPTYSAGPGIGINNFVIDNTGDTDPSDDIVQGSVAGGDLSGSFPNPSVSKLAGHDIASTTPTPGQVLKWNGAAWEPNHDNVIPNLWQYSSSSNAVYYQGGNVAIGSSLPGGFRLRVDGGGGVRINNPISGTEDGLFVTANSTDPDYAAIYASNNGAGAAGYFTSTNGLALYADGHVGFGTTTPTTHFEIQSNTSSTTNGVRVHNSGTGDAMLTFALGGSDEISMGVDNSDNDRFKISVGNSLTSNTALTIQADKNVGIGISNPPTALSVDGVLSGVNSSGSIRYYADVLNTGEGVFFTRGANGIDNVRLGSNANSNHGEVVVVNASGTEKAGLQINSSGQGVVFGDIKNFKMTHPNHPDKEIWYASLEGPEAAAYIRGTSHLINGRASIQFPEHFAAVANPETMTLILTPLSLDSKGLAVARKTTTGFEVGELMGGNGNYEFDWEVKCVRKGFESFEVVRAHSHSEK